MFTVEEAKKNFPQTEGFLEKDLERTLAACKQSVIDLKAISNYHYQTVTRMKMNEDFQAALRERLETMGWDSEITFDFESERFVISFWPQQETPKVGY